MTVSPLLMDAARDWLSAGGWSTGSLGRAVEPRFAAFTAQTVQLLALAAIVAVWLARAAGRPLGRRAGLHRPAPRLPGRVLAGSR